MAPPQPASVPGITEIDSTQLPPPTQTPRQLSQPQHSSEAEEPNQSNHSAASSSIFPVKSKSSALKLPLPPASHQWSRISLDLRSASVSPGSSLNQGHSGHSTSPDLAAAAATMRLAASRINLSPLVLPSPERELTDPMRDHTTTIPRSHLDEISASCETPTQDGTRRRLTSFWQGTQDVDGGHETNPMTHTLDRRTLSEPMADADHQRLPVSESTQSASATHRSDYFGNLEPISEEISKEAQLAFLRAASPFVETGTLSVPILPRTSSALLTRQTSSPLPAPVSGELPSGSRFRSESLHSDRVNWSAKEEQFFAERGYLEPPNPPDELERRRALHK